MKAAVVTKIGRLEVLDVPDPKLGPYDALCEMRYGSTCAGTDIHLMDGRHPFPVTFPTILGHESVGRVVEVGCKVRNLKVGQLISRVGAPAIDGLGSNWGGFAELGVAKDHWQMRRDGVELSRWNRSRVNQIIADGIDEREAPMLITWRETLSYITRIGVRAGRGLLVIGSGANALALAAHGCNLGASVVAVGSERHRNVFESLPIAGYVDYRSPELLERVRALLPGFDVLIDGVGGKDTVNSLLPLLRTDGTLGVYGWNGRGSYGLNPFAASGSFRVYADGYDEEESNQQVQTMMLCGMLKAELWYDADAPVTLEELPAAYDSLRGHEKLKVLVRLHRDGEK